MLHRPLLALLVCSALATGAAAQSGDRDSSSTAPQDTTTTTTTTTQQDDATQQIEPMDRTPVYRVNVTARTTKAVNYRHRSGSTKVDMKGTDLMPLATGDAKVNSRQGRLEIDLSMKKMKPATTFGPQYLTYVLWAITPEGRAQNLGEVLPNDDGNLDMRVTSDLQAFGLIITAEPYFAVTHPSSLVVAENHILPSTKGWEEPIDARFDVLSRNEYTADLNPAELPATTADRAKVGLDLMEARNAVAIAKAEGAEKYAPDALAKAQEFLNKGEDYLRRDQGRKAIGTVARGATQQAEDARELTIRRKNEERIANQRRKLEEQEQQARAQAELSANKAEVAQANAAEEQQRREQAEAQAEAQRRAAEEARLRAEQAAQQAAQQRAAAEAAQQSALQQQQQLQQQVQQARLTAQQAEQQKEQLRARLKQQLNTVLETRDTARGLIVNMSDVLFDTGKATLKPGARERLSRVAGIIMAYPDLRLQIEGYTDNVGSDSFNQVLSEKRAAAVRDYLIQQGVPLNNVTARGLGESDPVASNATPSGRQMNRRVDVVVTGESIQANANSEGTSTTGSAGTAGAASTAGTNATQPANQTTTEPATMGAPAGQTQPAVPATNPPASSNPREPVQPTSSVPK